MTYTTVAGNHLDHAFAEAVAAHRYSVTCCNGRVGELACVLEAYNMFLLNGEAMRPRENTAKDDGL